MLAARWKGGAPTAVSRAEEIQPGQVQTFRITKLDREAKKVELEAM